ncbi:uncharacterized protein LOC105206947 isoform X2 [Solenopsis invicta]|uniref:uncharacterized protein LOC105206947 isoform X2 n=1 Tax=Solenopsis invicta TaxID=13686 RepID=UPI00193E30A4|nr:uncharacterized protein LOC105206947 isoform X2 [Solenopsis invicta]
MKKKNMEAKFKPPPYNEEVFKEIENLVENNVDAPAEWPVYHVRVIARERNYTALKKLRLAQNQRYAFTTETDVEPEEKAAAIEREFKKETLFTNVSEIKSLMNVKPIEPKVYKKGKKRNIMSSLSNQPNSKYCRTSNEINYLDENDNWNDQEPQMMHRSNKSDVPIDEPSTSQIILDVMALVINENSTNQLDDTLFADSKLMDIPKNNAENTKSKTKR